MAVAEVKAALFHLLARRVKSQESVHRWVDYRLRQFAIRGRCSPVGKDEHASRLARSTAMQPLKQWRIK